MASASITKRNMKRKLRSGETVVLQRYVLNWRDPKTGARQQKFFERQKEAQSAQSQLLVELRQGTYHAKQEAPTVAQAFERWVEDRRGQVKATTLRGYESHRPYIVGPLLSGNQDQRAEYTVTKQIPTSCKLLTMLGGVKVTELTTAEIRTWHRLVSEEVGLHSANRAKQYLQTLLNLAAEDFNIRPPVLPRKTGKGKPREKKAILLPRQVGLLLERAKTDQEYGLYYAFPFLTGVRPSEMLALLWEDVDLENRKVHIRRMQERDGTITDTTKTAAGTRTIPMSPPLFDMVAAWKKKCPLGKPKDHLGEKYLYRVFPNLGFLGKWPSKERTGGGNCLLYTNFRQRVWAKALERTGLPYVTPHSARHCFISTLQAQGVEVGLVAKLAGHANASVTLGHYTQAVRGGEEAMELLASAFQ